LILHTCLFSQHGTTIPEARVSGVRELGQETGVDFRDPGDQAAGAVTWQRKTNYIGFGAYLQALLLLKVDTTQWKV